MSLGAVDRANEDIERAINYARTKGKDTNGNPYYFIDIILTDAGPLAGDPQHFAISGIKELVPLKPTIDRNGGMVWRFNEEMGGYTRFRDDGRGQWKYSMWDDPESFNRRFLASHWDEGIWEIEDPVIEAQILELYEQMKAEAKKETPVQKRLLDLQKKYKEAKEDNKKGIMDQIQALINEHEKEILPPPPQGHEIKKRRDKYRIPPTPEQLARAKERPREELPPVIRKQSVVRVDEQ